MEYTSGETMRDVGKATRANNCIDEGDSGGPVYTIKNSTGVIARGIISGKGVASGSCVLYFTDSWDAGYVLPGGAVQRS